MRPNRDQVVQGQVETLLKVEFIREIMYSTWLSNIMMVPKLNGKWRVCINYTDLNKACLKDSYPLPSINGLVGAASEFRYLTFVDTYLGNNQILMHPYDQEKMAYISPMANYCYKVMSFELKNAGATYQRLMNKIFSEHIESLMEVYIDEMLVKTEDDSKLISDLEMVFNCLQRHNMRLNP